MKFFYLALIALQAGLLIAMAHQNREALIYCQQLLEANREIRAADEELKAADEKLKASVWELQAASNQLLELCQGKRL